MPHTPSPNTKGFISSYRSNDIRLDFMFNPSSISEKRSIDYNFSEGQGQLLPLAQYGRIGNTVISFDLFMFNHNGLRSELTTLRKIMLPKQVTKLSHYAQAQPHTLDLSLDSYGFFTGVINNLEISTKQYHKATLVPIQLTAKISFVITSVTDVLDTTTQLGIIESSDTVNRGGSRGGV